MLGPANLTEQREAVLARELDVHQHQRRPLRARWSPAARRHPPTPTTSCPRRVSRVRNSFMLSGLSSTIRILATIHLSGGKKHASGGPADARSPPRRRPDVSGQVIASSDVTALERGAHPGRPSDRVCTGSGEVVLRPRDPGLFPRSRRDCAVRHDDRRRDGRSARRGRSGGRGSCRCSVENQSSYR